MDMSMAVGWPFTAQVRWQPDNDDAAIANKYDDGEECSTGGVENLLKDSFYNGEAQPTHLDMPRPSCLRLQHSAKTLRLHFTGEENRLMASLRFPILFNPHRPTFRHGFAILSIATTTSYESCPECSNDVDYQQRVGEQLPRLSKYVRTYSHRWAWAFYSHVRATVPSRVR